jgi:hypothetical protein
MDKLFYSLEEAAQRLGKTADQVRQMAASGQLSEFRDRDKLMFKKEQVDLLAGGEEEPLKLADSGELEPLSLQSSGTGLSIKDDAKSDTGGISLLDDSTGDEDANAVTRITPSAALVDPGEGRRSNSASGSGSAGLLDLTREADDTSLGAGLLDDVYGNETVASASAPGAEGGSTDADQGGALFENPVPADATFEGAAAATTGGAAALALAEPYDGPGSGLVGGLAVGAIAALGIAAFALISVMSSGGGSRPNDLLTTLSTNWMAVVGGCAGLTLIAALLGWFLGRKS